MWTEPVAFFQTLRRRLEAFTAPPLLPGDFVSSPDQRVLWDSSPECWMGKRIPPNPSPPPSAWAPFPAFTVRSVELPPSEEEYLAHYGYIQGVSDARCLLRHQLATIKTPRVALYPLAWAEVERQCVNSRNMAEMSWQWGICSFIMACETKKIQDLLWDQGKKPTRDRKCKTDLREEGGGRISD